MKSRFEEPVIELIRLHQNDVIATSNGGLNSDEEFTGGGKDYGDLLG